MTEQKRKAEKLSGVKGMNDILPQDAHLWEFFESTVKSMLRSYGYQNIRTPIVEHTQLFTRGIGEVTDIVEKEMYSFTDALNGENLTLRPENTAAVVRASIEHNLLYDGPKRLWYVGPMFRHERPQRGRYRQFHQVGVEALGFAGPDADAEIILMCQRLWDDLGLTGIKLEINSLGLAEERAAHRVELIAYLEKHVDALDEDAKRRLYTNPLRVLDTKNPALQEIAANAPKLIDFLRDESRAHFDGLQRILKANNIPFTINPRLVRGLDYYNLTVFEWITDKLGAQGTVAAGGRYDPLIEQLGGKPTAACGWAMGVERILELLKDENLVPEADGCDVYVVHQGDAARDHAFIVAERLRDTGLDVILHCSADGQSASFKSQMKRADASGAAFAVILGDDEVAQGVAGVKPLRGVAADARNEQQAVALGDLTEYLINAMVASAEDGDD
ncbi:histidine--tRNA ligase [Paraburkholderia caballeronis]|uniref:Histidine--tRNA ligase n=1 Tax=Paraburkholderia caballeronis TaxID=416943 RepID=A0A1H7N645_9BURK|nr:histidine--tRNA ligase [Paraburkholderia caballeronis]PXW26252.1 histidyl-tRNA synthetase [Paraburkholderia caballeronis]PXX01799.1 histidyl-tRNA synthetase [Paraburkholderia caballeronis]RAK00956.1 histidyl-tRNA synthetase [Paraburkholderia caballeronis]TDV20809.1 histidyl-tRNA synthetase [Paraburkholderia caballeronis]TDV21239.1 histidyl-tRNA synthetase [Paraburkholderia caballeronis]